MNLELLQLMTVNYVKVVKVLFISFPRLCRKAEEMNADCSDVADLPAFEFHHSTDIPTVEDIHLLIDSFEPNTGLRNALIVALIINININININPRTADRIL